MRFCAIFEHPVFCGLCLRLLFGFWKRIQAMFLEDVAGFRIVQVLLFIAEWCALFNVCCVCVAFYNVCSYSPPQRPNMYILSITIEIVVSVATSVLLLSYSGIVIMFLYALSALSFENVFGVVFLKG
jgi:hypothetical protein